MTAAALPIALVVGVIVELVSGLTTWLIAREGSWWRRVGGIWSDALRMLRDRGGRERVAVIEAGGAAAAMLGSGIAAAGALGVGPGDLPLLYLSLAVGSAGAMVAVSAAETPTARARAGRERLRAALAEPAIAVGLGAMFLRYGTLDLDAVRGTQTVLGTGLLLGPGLALAGLATAAVALVAAGVLRLASAPEAMVVGRARGLGGGTSLLIRLCRWSLGGATCLVTAVLLAGGGIDPFTLSTALPVFAGALGVAVVMGVADALLARLPEPWRGAAPLLALVLAGIAVALVVLA
jgi:hypothetical protein